MTDEWKHTHNLIRDGVTTPVYDLCGAFITKEEWEQNCASRYYYHGDGFYLDCEEADPHKAIIEEGVDFTLEWA